MDKNSNPEKIYKALKSTYNNKYLEMDVSFLMNGILMEIIKYFRNESDYSLDDLLLNMQKWFEKIFD